MGANPSVSSHNEFESRVGLIGYTNMCQPTACRLWSKKQQETMAIQEINMNLK